MSAYPNRRNSSLFRYGKRPLCHMRALTWTSSTILIYESKNPPSIPTLALVWLVGSIRGSKVIIDWHNLGCSILALKLGYTHPLVKISEWWVFRRCIERVLIWLMQVRGILWSDRVCTPIRDEGHARRAVRKMASSVRRVRPMLTSNSSVCRGRRVVLHDRPPAHFHRASPAEMHEVCCRLHRSTSNIHRSTPAISPSLRDLLENSINLLPPALLRTALDTLHRSPLPGTVVFESYRGYPRGILQSRSPRNTGNARRPPRTPRLQHVVDS